MGARTSGGIYYPEGFPTAIGDTVSLDKPIASDSLGSDISDTNPADAWNGHRLNGQLINVNVLMGDGHVETHGVSQLKLILPSSISLSKFGY